MDHRGTNTSAMLHHTSLSSLMLLLTLSSHAQGVLNDNINYALHLDGESYCGGNQDVGSDEDVVQKIAVLESGVLQPTLCYQYAIDECGTGPYSDWIYTTYDQPSMLHLSFWVEAYESDNTDECTYYSSDDDYAGGYYAQLSNGLYGEFATALGAGIPNVLDNSYSYCGTSDLFCTNSVHDFNVSGIWSYVHGKSPLDPLNFGALAVGQSYSNFNSNRSNSYSGFSAVNDPGSTYNSPDVHYSFEVPGNDIMHLTITLNSTMDGVMRLLHADGTSIALVDNTFSPGTETTSNSLCPGSYRLVVEGFDLQEGSFTLSVAVTGSSVPQISATCQDQTIYLYQGIFSSVDFHPLVSTTNECPATTTTTWLEPSSMSFFTSDVGPNPVTIMVTNSAGATATCVSTITVVNTTGVQEARWSDEVHVGPNPSEGEIRVELGPEAPNAAEAQLIDASGQLLELFQLVRGSQVLDLTALAKGTYLLRIRAEDEEVVHRIQLH